MNEICGVLNLQSPKEKKKPKEDKQSRVKSNAFACDTLIPA